MRTLELIKEAYKAVKNGRERMDIRDTEVIVKCYWVGPIIRIDIKENK